MTKRGTWTIEMSGLQVQYRNVITYYNYNPSFSLAKFRTTDRKDKSLSHRPALGRITKISLTSTVDEDGNERGACAPISAARLGTLGSLGTSRHDPTVGGAVSQRCLVGWLITR